MRVVEKHFYILYYANVCENCMSALKVALSSIFFKSDTKTPFCNIAENFSGQNNLIKFTFILSQCLSILFYCSACVPSPPPPSCHLVKPCTDHVDGFVCWKIGTRPCVQNKFLREWPFQQLLGNWTYNRLQCKITLNLKWV